MAQQLATAAHAGGLCGSGGLRAQPHRRSGRGGLSCAGPCVSARQALCRGRSRLWPRLGAPTANWPTTRIFSTPRRAMMPATMPAAESRFCMDSPLAIRKASSMSRRRSLRPTCCWRMNKLPAARQVLAAAAGTEAADRPGFQLVEGRSGAGARPAAGCGRRPSSRSCWRIP